MLSRLAGIPFRIGGLIGVSAVLASVLLGFGEVRDSLGAPGALAGRSLESLWQAFHPGSLTVLRETQLAGPPWVGALFDRALHLPAYGALGILGTALTLLAMRSDASQTGQARVRPVQESAASRPAAGRRPPAPGTELRRGLRACRNAFIGVGLFTAFVNILMLTGSFYMLEVYDRVLPSRSVPTLLALSVLAAGLFAMQAMLEIIRSRVLVRIGSSLDESLNGRIYDTIVRLPLKAASKGDGLQPMRDLDSIRSFLSGLGPTALFDLPWMPLYLGIIFVFHPLLGFTALAGAIVLVALTLLTEMLTKGPTAAATGHAIARSGLAEAGRRNAEVLTAMGMSGRMRERWQEANSAYLESQRRVNDVSGGLGAISKILRMVLQSAMLGVGAWLVIGQEATAGIIIAGSILSGRALAPVDLAIANWKGFVVARQAWQRLSKLLAALPAQADVMELPAPKSTLAVEGVAVAPPGTTRVVVSEATFALKAGQGLGIIGASASGKSSLARMLVGVWQPARGKIRLDGAALDQWSVDLLGRHVGYLPQDVELFAGTIAENISRFDARAESTAVIAAAKAAGVHDMIVNLPNGYETEIGEHGSGLSAGQQQRVALARALYGDPFLVVLDEPNSNLDAEGEAALTQAILGVRARNGVVVVIAHRPTALAGVDMLLVMSQGRAQGFGPKDEILARMTRPAPPVPLKVVPESGVARP